MSSSEFNARARTSRSSPETSLQAARSLGELTAKQRAVLNVLRYYGPMTDEQIATRYNGRDDVPAQSESGLRTRRAELVVRGLIRDSHRRAKLPTGRNAIVWEPTIDREDPTSETPPAQHQPDPDPLFDPPRASPPPRGPYDVD